MTSHVSKTQFRSKIFHVTHISIYASNRSPGSLPVPRRLVTTALYMSVIPLLLTMVCILRWVIFVKALLWHVNLDLK